MRDRNRTVRWRRASPDRVCTPGPSR